VTDPRAVLRKHGLSAKRSFGQNFLVADSVVRAIAAACVPDDEVGRATVVEIGAGTGTLTEALLERAARVIAIERDRDLVPVLRAELGERPSLEIVEADAQTAPIDVWLSATPPPRVLAGNLPYSITGSLIERATELSGVLERVVVMVQAEVAERLLAHPGTKTYGALTVFVRAAFDIERVMTVSPGSFHPAPEVTRAVVRMRPRKDRIEETTRFRAVVKAAFSARRKTLRNAWGRLADRPALEEAARVAGVSLDARGETLDVDAFARVARALG
jgi:16S rRNA (adenine1518-N6/adenine1519-N6)-dimethyltransferase